jgi:transglutaminase-like putative cysteine protease
MRLRIAHSSVYRYDPPTAGVIQVLRLTPRNHEGQHIGHWRIDVTPDARLASHEDAFGNITHVFTADGPLDELTVAVDGEVETQNTDGVVRGTVERFPPSLFLRDTALTQADTAIRDWAAKIRAASGGEVLAELHGLLDRLFEDIASDSATGNAAASPAPVNAAEAFTRKQGAPKNLAPKDLAHVFIGAAHSLGIPARYVSGYFRKSGESADADTSHAWAEAYVPGLGWVSFDPSTGVCPTDAHVRVAIGLDSLGAAAVRGTRMGVSAETATVAIKVDQ